MDREALLGLLAYPGNRSKVSWRSELGACGWAITIKMHHKDLFNS
jgi:hypothetical protein